MSTDLPISSQIGVDPKRERGRERERERGRERERRGREGGGQRLK